MMTVVVSRNLKTRELPFRIKTANREIKTNCEFDTKTTFTYRRMKGSLFQANLNFIVDG